MICHLKTRDGWRKTLREHYPPGIERLIVPSMRSTMMGSLYNFETSPEVSVSRTEFIKVKQKRRTVVVRGVSKEIEEAWFEEV